jgi:probable O-glycosylation ligase (exosortase A-associated)
MRDIALAILMAIITPLGIFHPWMGTMNWAFVSLFSPHRLAYGFMYSAPVSMMVGLSTLLGLLFSKDPKRLVMKGALVWMSFFALWMVVTFPFSLDGMSAENGAQLDKVMKIMLMNIIAATVISSRKQIDVLIAVCALSIGFYGVKGGIFTLMTGGSFRVRGVGGFIAGNNEVGLAFVMVIPLMFYLLTIATRRWVRWAYMAAIFLTSLAAIGTQSRGAMLAMVGMSAAFIYRSPARAKVAVPFLAAACFIPFFMPESWWARMDTISNYEQDESAMGRLNAWEAAWNIAVHNFFGGGFVLETPEIFGRYAPNPFDMHVAHSIYFQVLGQHGFIGLFLFLALWISVWRTTRWISKNSNIAEDKMLARMIEVSLIGFAIGGAFLNLAYFDGPYYLMVAMMVLRYKLMNNLPVSQAAAMPNGLTRQNPR